jgi:hypothetical protein
MGFMVKSFRGIGFVSDQFVVSWKPGLFTLRLRALLIDQAIELAFEYE